MYIRRANKEKREQQTTLIKFFLSGNIRSLRNTTHSNERYVPITGYRRQNYTKTKYIYFTRSPQIQSSRHSRVRVLLSHATLCLSCRLCLLYLPIISTTPTTSTMPTKLNMLRRLLWLLSLLYRPCAKVAC